MIYKRFLVLLKFADSKKKSRFEIPKNSRFGHEIGVSDSKSDVLRTGKASFGQQSESADSKIEKNRKWNASGFFNFLHHFRLNYS